MFSFERATGNFDGLLDSGGLVGVTGYAGHGAGLDNPALSDVRNVGPLPAGFYTIGSFEDRPVVGEFAAPLTPDPSNEMFGRSDFFIHGDNPGNNHSASDGCIVLPRQVRELIAASRMTRLQVI